MPDPCFSGFESPTIEWFESTFKAPTRVQREGWPAITAGEHALLLAPTGSGKTLAAFLAALDRLQRLPPDAAPGVRVLYISPLKALVYDIERNLRAPLDGLAAAAARQGSTPRVIRVDIRTGDTTQRDRRLQIKNPAEVLVTTPESLFLLLGSKARHALRSVQTVIVDEIHVLAGGKRGAHLALSLERLSAWCERDPQRVGLSATQRPLETIARFLGGDRPVTIVDTSEPPHIDLRIVVPVDNMDHPVADVPRPRGGDGQLQRVGGAPDGTLGERRTAGMWPVIHPKILELIRNHRSTIVFTNSRILCERLAQRLNDLAGEDLVRAHHGSISHTQRAATEDLLKQGKLPAIVATSSLELGIDMGAVDLVVLVESPGSVARGLQRIGRAGHSVGQVSNGVLFPKFKGDLLECAVVATHMAEGRIEQTQVPRNCLDVLSQQLVATCAMGEWSVDDLVSMVRRAFPYADLSDASFYAVLDMLAGRYPSDAFADLAPRLSWDRTTDRIKSRRGAKTLALMNAGTIPDRGLYGVFLAGEGGPRLGELDEEMVYESRVGDHIILGASTWRVEEITRDQVIVSPAPGEPGRLPFWHGDRPGRSIDLGRAIGAFAREMGALDPSHAAAALQQRAPVDAWAAQNLCSYLAEQRAATQVIPSDRTLVVERFRDQLGDWRVCILSPFGTRVHAPWAMAIEAQLSASTGYEVQTLWTDDGISLRFAYVDELPDLGALFPDPEEVEEQVIEQLGRSALFAARFRENAARALLLPRRSFKGRTPLWQQRLKSQQLQSVAMGFPAFPIVLETYRECLADVFDLDGLRDVLGSIRRRDIHIHEVETPRPSPFARSLVFAFVAAYMYDGDAPQAERRALALTLDRTLLRELLGHQAVHELLEPSAVDQVALQLQCLTPERTARDVDGLHDLLRRLGDLSASELAARSNQAPDAWLTALEAKRQALPIHIGGELRWIAGEDAGRYRDALGLNLPPSLPPAYIQPVEHALEQLVLRYARTHIPFPPGDLARRYGLSVGVIDAVLSQLQAGDNLERGRLRPRGGADEVCHPDVMRRMRRRSLAELRNEVASVEADVYGRFLLSWHGIGSTHRGPGRLEQVVRQLEGLALPWSELEASILPSRMRDYRPEMLDQMGMMGLLVWVGSGALGPRDGRVALIRREQAATLIEIPEAAPGFFDDPVRKSLWEHLETRGACFLVELQRAANAPLAGVTQALWDLVWAGMVTNDTFLPLRGLQRRARQGSARRARTAGGRWSTVVSLLNEPASPTRRAHTQAMQLFERYGIASSRAAHAEALPKGFGAVYPVLKAMEEAGKARRGWFVEGLGGAQFAQPGAVDQLRGCRRMHAEVQVLAAVDPANPYGALLDWPGEHALRRDAGARVVFVGGAPVLYLARGGRSLSILDDTPSLLGAALPHLRHAHRGKLLRIQQINGIDALDAPLRPLLIEAGFAADYKGLMLE